MSRLTTGQPERAEHLIQQKQQILYFCFRLRVCCRYNSVNLVLINVEIRFDQLRSTYYEIDVKPTYGNDSAANLRETISPVFDCRHHHHHVHRTDTIKTHIKTNNATEHD